ncbi:hypothetical protein CCH79_00002154, partial [Gambusia affinis]
SQFDSRRDKAHFMLRTVCQDTVKLFPMDYQRFSTALVLLNPSLVNTQFCFGTRPLIYYHFYLGVIAEGTIPIDLMPFIWQNCELCQPFEADLLLPVPRRGREKACFLSHCADCIVSGEQPISTMESKRTLEPIDLVVGAGLSAYLFPPVSGLAKSRVGVCEGGHLKNGGWRITKPAPAPHRWSGNSCIQTEPANMELVHPAPPPLHLPLRFAESDVRAVPLALFICSLFYHHRRRHANPHGWDTEDCISIQYVEGSTYERSTRLVLLNKREDLISLNVFDFQVSTGRLRGVSIHIWRGSSAPGAHSPLLLGSPSPSSLCLCLSERSVPPFAVVEVRLHSEEMLAADCEANSQKQEPTWTFHEACRRGHGSNQLSKGRFGSFGMTEILVSDVNLNSMCERLEQQCCVDQNQHNLSSQPQTPVLKRHSNTGAKLWGRVRSKLLRQKLDPQTVQSKNWHMDVIEMNGIKVEFSMKFTSRDLSLKRTPSKKQSGVFGVKINVVTKRERSKVPYIVRQCIEEVEKRGIDEVGIYRISGVATDIQALKLAFDTNTKDILVMLSDMDINAIAGTLKLYFRELPEPLLTDRLYPAFMEGIGWLRRSPSTRCPSITWAPCSDPPCSGPLSQKAPRDSTSHAPLTSGHMMSWLRYTVVVLSIIVMVQVLLYYLQHPPISFAELKRNTLYFSTDV